MDRPVNAMPWEVLAELTRRSLPARPAAAPAIQAPMAPVAPAAQPAQAPAARPSPRPQFSGPTSYSSRRQEYRAALKDTTLVDALLQLNRGLQAKKAPPGHR